MLAEALDENADDVGKSEAGSFREDEVAYLVWLWKLVERNKRAPK